MTATIEELGCHLIAWEIVYRTETYQYAIVYIRIFTKRNGEFVTLDGKRYVHQSFQVALDKVILLQFFTGHCIETGMKSLYYLQLFIHQIATEPDCRNAGIIEDIAVNLILVDVLGKQQADV